MTLNLDRGGGDRSETTQQFYFDFSPRKASAVCILSSHNHILPIRRIFFRQLKIVKYSMGAQATELKDLINRTGFSLEEIAEKAVIKLSTLKKVLNGSHELSQPSMRSIRAIEQVPVMEFHGDSSRVVRKLRYVRVVSWAQAGEATAFEDLPNEWMKKIPADVDDDKAFGVEIKGDSMEPKFWEGETAILLPNRHAKNGDLVVAKLKKGGIVFKLFHLTGSKFRLTSYNPAYPPLEYAEKDFHWIYPVYNVVRHVYN